MMAALMGETFAERIRRTRNLLAYGGAREAQEELVIEGPDGRTWRERSEDAYLLICAAKVLDGDYVPPEPGCGDDHRAEYHPPRPLARRSTGCSWRAHGYLAGRPALHVPEGRGDAMTTKTNGYPFVTKRQIADHLESSEDFRNEAMLVLYRRQTEDEQETSETKWKNRRGFMSSHAVHGTRIAKALLAGEPLSDEDRGRVSAIACRYTKQLAAHFRAEQLAAQPELAEKGKVFGV